MENLTFKTAVVGGFERQSVIDYIEKSARESAELTERLEKDVETLREGKSSMEAELTQLRGQVEKLEKENAGLAAEAKTLRSCDQQLRETQPRLSELEVELELLRPEVEAYDRVKAHIGDIECNARKRADELETSAVAKVSGMLNEFKAQYREMVSIFETTSSHVVSELRKVEVNLSQLPVTFDKMNGELAELEAVLKKD